jgi:hypothetical protein
MTIFSLKNNTQTSQKHCVPINGKIDDTEWIEVEVSSDTFIAKSTKGPKSFDFDQWEMRNNLPFPSALLSAFLNNK